MNLNQEGNNKLSATNLIELILKKKEGVGQTYANQLLDLLYSGYPVSEIHPLLTSNDPEILDLGIWITSELGELGSELIPYIAPALSSCDASIRFWAIDSLITKVNHPHGEVIATVIFLINDHDENVRWKVLDFLSRIPIECFRAARNCDFPKNNIEYKSGLYFIEKTVHSKRKDINIYDNITTLIKNKSRTSIFLGAVAAFRYAKIDERPFLSLKNSSNEEVVSYFNSMYEEVFE